ncbi:MAG: thiol-disulfide oxidoreductase DCC family protein [Cyclobacteriaceae bacterium]|nr:thiol-disulfide oxidoreductase DCC family protein [Cyclobacteriaceae bacterium]
MDSIIAVTKQLILFDGVCNLCNGAVNFIIDRDKKEKFQFATLQSDKGKHLLRRIDLPTDKLNTIVLIDQSKIYTKSTAVLHITKQLSGFWSLLFVLIIVPRFIRDECYDIVARSRYKWFGKTNACRVPTPNLIRRFI